MNVQGATTGGSASNAYQVAQLQKQITKVQNQISQIQSDGGLDDESKSTQLSVYQTQLTQLQTQLSQAQRASSPTAVSESVLVDQRDSISNRKEASSPAVRPFGAGQYLDESV